MRGEVAGRGNGTATIHPDVPVRVKARGSWVITYTAGERGIEVGGSVRLEIPNGFSMPQLHYPELPGHTSATCSNPRVKLQLTLDWPAGRRAYVTRWGRHVYIKVLDERLAPGETITITYGNVHRFAFVGAEAPILADLVEFTVATDTDGQRRAPFSGYYLLPESPRLRIINGSARTLRVLVPSQAEVGKPVEVSVVAEDESGNVATDFQGEISWSSPDETAILPPMTSFVGNQQGIHRPEKGITFLTPGEKRIRVEGPNGLVGESPPLEVGDTARELKIYWGDLHGHTALSDGFGTPEDYYQYAREVAGLDFAAISDHAQYMSDEDWEHIKDVGRRFYQPGRFVTILGYEFSHNPVKPPYYGDKCVYYPELEGPLLRETDMWHEEYVDLPSLGEQFKAHGALMVIHAHAHGVTSYYDPHLTRLYEIHSIWGSSEYPGNPRPVLSFHRQDASQDCAQAALAKGFRVGFTGSSDCHMGRPGYTRWLARVPAYRNGLVAVLASALTRKEVFGALWDRRCYATTGEKILLDFTLEGHQMGEELTLPPGQKKIRARVKVTGTGDLGPLTIVKNGRDFYTYQGLGPTASFEWVDQEIGGPSYYYLRVTQKDGATAWSSPIWVDQSSFSQDC
ncbi:MAG: CehA/McbA family metallohydrolase [Firmicutes bacterium]|nr:CehA/McbA family metallohydrolase [Bacillota bacterium]MCL5038898.1 CehA/McbA family metallohydrolase [Bacillota bacterium]